MLWHDNCMIPLHAAHPVDAMEWINFYYQPKVAGDDRGLGQLRLPGARRPSR